VVTDARSCSPWPSVNTPKAPRRRSPSQHDAAKRTGSGHRPMDRGFGLEGPEARQRASLRLGGWVRNSDEAASLANGQRSRPNRARPGHSGAIRHVPPPGIVAQPAPRAISVSALATTRVRSRSRRPASCQRACPCGRKRGQSLCRSVRNPSSWVRQVPPWRPDAPLHQDRVTELNRRWADAGPGPRRPTALVVMEMPSPLAPVHLLGVPVTEPERRLAPLCDAATMCEAWPRQAFLQDRARLRAKGDAPTICRSLTGADHRQPANVRRQGKPRAAHIRVVVKASRPGQQSSVASNREDAHAGTEAAQTAPSIQPAA